MVRGGKHRLGKSTLVAELEKAGFSVLHEPVEKWRSETDDGEKGILEKFYADKQKFSFAMQIAATTSRISALIAKLRSGSAKKLVVERSFLTDRHVFAMNLLRSKHLSDTEWDIFLENSKLLEELCKEVFSKCHFMFLFLNTDPATCQARCVNRDRREEGAAVVDLRYLIELHDRHCEWLQSEKMVDHVWTLDGNKNVESVVKQALKILK